MFKRTRIVRVAPLAAAMCGVANLAATVRAADKPARRIRLP